MPTHEALARAKEQDLNLVEVAPNSRPPVCRILDYGRYKYEQKQEQKRRKKNQIHVEIKEVKFRPKVERHDYDFKVRHVVRFLSEGNKVKCTIMFRGREMAHTEFGEAILHRLLADLEGKLVIEQPPRLEGRNMTMLISAKPGAFPKKERPPEEPKKGKRGGEDGDAEEENINRDVEEEMAAEAEDDADKPDEVRA